MRFGSRLQCAITLGLPGRDARQPMTLPAQLDKHPMTPTQPDWVVCDHCGLAHQWLRLSPRSLSHCSRCNAVMGRGHRLGPESLLALTTAALLVFLIAHGSELLSIRLAGAEQSTTFWRAVSITWEHGDQAVALLAATTALLAPALFIGLRLYILLPMVWGREAAGHAACLRLAHYVSRWNTVEVLTVGALLALVRIAQLAQATPGPGLVALAVLALLLAAVESAGLRHLYWQAKRQAPGNATQAAGSGLG